MPLSQQSLSGKLLPPTAFQSHSPLFLCPQILLQWSAEWSLVSIPQSAGHNLQFVPPMLLRRVPQLPEGSEWQYEVKWDGYRIQAIKCGRSVRLISRNGADFTRRFPEVAESVARLKASKIHLDGELVPMDQQGRPSFQVLQGGLPLPKGWRFGFYAFDLLNLKGRDLQNDTLVERRARLQEVINGSGLRFSPALDGDAQAIVTKTNS